MASTVTIILTGVVYLTTIPQPTPKMLRALMVKSDNDRVSTQAGAIPRHVAFIKIPSGKLQQQHRGKQTKRRRQRCRRISRGRRAGGGRHAVGHRRR